MSPSQPLYRADDIPDGGAVAVEQPAAGLESLLLTRRGAQVFGYHNSCPHAGRRLDWSPGKFLFDNGLLVCTAHGACFDIADGRCLSGPCRGESLIAVPVVVENGDVRLATG